MYFDLFKLVESNLDDKKVMSGLSDYNPFEKYEFDDLEVTIAYNNVKEEINDKPLIYKNSVRAICKKLPMVAGFSFDKSLTKEEVVSDMFEMVNLKRLENDESLAEVANEKSHYLNKLLKKACGIKQRQMRLKMAEMVGGEENLDKKFEEFYKTPVEELVGKTVWNDKNKIKDLMENQLPLEELKRIEAELKEYYDDYVSMMRKYTPLTAN